MINKLIKTIMTVTNKKVKKRIKYKFLKKIIYNRYNKIDPLEWIVFPN